MGCKDLFLVVLILLGLTVVGLIRSVGFAAPKSEIIVSAEKAVYCLDSDGSLKWSFPHDTVAVGYECSGPAIGDINGDGMPEIVVGAADSLYCLNYNGTLKWSYPMVKANVSSPVIANIDTIGDAEVIAADACTLYCFNSDGTVKWSYAVGGSYIDRFGPAVTVANIVATSGTPEVLCAYQGKLHCINSDGSLVWDFGLGAWSNEYTFIAVADVDLDGLPEIIVIQNKDKPIMNFDYDIYCIKGDGTEKWHIYGNNGWLSQPAIADINNDGKVEIVFANCQYPLSGSPKMVRAFQEDSSGTGLVELWASEYIDATPWSAPSPVICDIDGDGDKDVIFVGGTFEGSLPVGVLYIYNGLDGKHPDNSGAPYYTNDNFASRTVSERGVAVADIDGDGHIEIVGISANSGDTYGVAVLGCNTWASGRNLFTSHLYHITDIKDDLTVPRIEPNNWESHNTWITQLTTGGSGFGTPTLKWDYADSTFGWVISPISIASVYNPIGVKERDIIQDSGVKVFYKNGRIVVAFGLSKSEVVSFRIFDIAGRVREVQTMGKMASGRHEIQLNLSNFMNGVYFIQAHIGEKTFNCKTIVIR